MLARESSLRNFRIFPRSHFDHASALRCVGQALDARNASTFDLRCEENALRLVCGFRAPPCDTAKDLRYTEEDLIRLDDEGKARRSRAAIRMVDFASATQILRSLGAFIDKKRGQLVRVSNHVSSTAERSVLLEYKTETGELHREKMPLSSVYDLAVRMYKERGRKYAVGRIFTDRR